MLAVAAPAAATCIRLRRLMPSRRSFEWDVISRPSRFYSLRSLFGVRCGFLGGASAPEDAGHRVVRLMTGVFVDRLFALPHRNHGGPGLGPHRRIVDSEFVLQRIGAGAREALDQVRIRAGARKIRPALEIDRVDDKRVALPMPA